MRSVTLLLLISSTGLTMYSTSAQSFPVSFPELLWRPSTQKSPTRRLRTRAEQGACIERSTAPVCPDMMFMGQSWQHWVQRYRQVFNAAPRLYRVLRLDETRAALIGCFMESDGYGRVEMIQTLHVHALSRVIREQGSEDAIWIADMSIDHTEAHAAMVNDESLHAHAYAAWQVHVGVDVRTWKVRVGEDLQSGRPLRVRAALERLRAEMAMCVRYAPEDMQRSCYAPIGCDEIPGI